MRLAPLQVPIANIPEASGEILLEISHHSVRSFSGFGIALETPHGRDERVTKFFRLLNLVIEVSKVLVAGNKWRLIPAFEKTARV